MTFNINQLRAFVGDTAFHRGLAYFKQGRARLLNYDKRSDVAFFTVTGTKPYQVILHNIKTDNLQGYCDCPADARCKHLAAAGLQWLSQAVQFETEVMVSTKIESETALSQWLANIPKIDSEIQKLKPGRHYLLYMLEEIRGKLKLYTKKGYLKQNGEWSQLKFYTPDGYDLEWRTPDYIDKEDLAILLLLPRVRPGEYRLEGESGKLALTHLLKLERFYWVNGNKNIRSGSARKLEWQWQEQSGKFQLQACLAEVSNWRLLDLDWPTYIDRDRAQIGKILTDLPQAQLAHLMSMPSVSETELNQAALHLRQVFNQTQLPLPQEPDIKLLDTPIPCLELVMFKTGHAQFPACRFGFRYGDIHIANQFDDDINTTPQIYQQQNSSCLIKRNVKMETSYQEELYQLGLRFYKEAGDQQDLWAVGDVTALEVFTRWQELVDSEFPTLISQGWRIDGLADYKAPIKQAEFAVQLADKPNHWFEFGLQISVGDLVLDLPSVVGYWLDHGTPPELLLPFGDGEWVQIDTQPLQAIHNLIIDLFQQKKLNKLVSLPGFQAAQLLQLPNLNDRRAPLTRKLLQRLQDFNGLESISVSHNLQAELREYQQQGLNWLGFLHQYGFGGILADDMGLGKTLQTIALVQYLKDNKKLKKPVLIIAPTSLMGNWTHELQRFAPKINALLIHGAERAEQFKKIAKSDLIITSYPLVMRDLQHYTKHNFELVVLDEAQAIKNPSTKISQAVRELKASCRICLTGTPLENHLGELWSLMDFALPGLLGGYKTFQQTYRTPIEQQNNKEQQKHLAQRVAPFMLRRTKTEVVKELPQKTEMVQYLELATKQRTLYESIRSSMEKRIREIVAKKGLARSHIEFLDALLKLRQACIDPRLVKLEKAADINESAKMEWLMENLPSLVEEGRKCLVFSQFTEVLALIEDMLTKLKLDYCKLTGQTRKRQEAIDRFQQGDVSIFLISLKAGGSGLNLTAADVVIHVDPWWNPAVENQATDRAYRIGQDKPVFVYKLVAADTVEERIQQMQQQKQALADSLFDETGAAGMPQDKEALLTLLS